MMADAGLQQQSYERMGQQGYGQPSDHDGYGTGSTMGGVSKRGFSTPRTSMKAPSHLNTSGNISSGVKRAASSDDSLDEDDVPDSATSATAQETNMSTNGTPSRKKQKRNKPTLSCAECVERKTKCDRTRPSCLACVKRQSTCRYSDIANLIAANGNGRSSSKHRKSTGSISSKHPGAPNLANTGFAVKTAPSLGVDFHSGLPTPRSFGRSTSISSQQSVPLLLSHVPHTTNTPSIVFGTGSQHPFANYWTTQGGIAEVVGVLPQKQQADTFVAKYFESVDPVYPMLHKEAFYAEYDQFWSLPDEAKKESDASLLALHFAMYAMGAQFLKMESEQARQQISEFYVSAAHQSLRLYPFLSKTSLRSIEAMVLITYFLMNDNKATDAWAFSGILVKQAYAMGLHRDPDIIVPRASPLEKNQRRKVWQAVFYQDTFFTVLVKLPPTTTFSDVNIDSLTEDSVIVGVGPNGEAEEQQSSSVTVITNPMSISAIAPRQLTPPIPPPPHTSVTTKNDTLFIRSMWRLAELVQRTICDPRALARPIVQNAAQKTRLLNQFRSLYTSFPPNLTDADPSRFAALVANQPRIARQSLFLRSNFWHCVMLIEADSNDQGGVRPDFKGALEAGMTAIAAFFDFWRMLTGDASVWWVFQHRAFEEALTMAGILSAYNAASPLSSSSPFSNAIHQFGNIENLFAKAKDDVRSVLEILEQVGNSSPEMQKTRTDVLRAAYENIDWNGNGLMPQQHGLTVVGISAG